MSGISFEGIGEMAATFAVHGTVEVGQAVKVSGAGTVSACAEGDKFCGVVLAVRDDLAAVQLGGLAQMKKTGAVTAGWVSLAADGAGGVKQQADGREALVVSSTDSAVVVRL